MLNATVLQVASGCFAVGLLLLALDIWRDSAAIALGVVLFAMFLVPKAVIAPPASTHQGIGASAPSLSAVGLVVFALAIAAIGSAAVNPSVRLLPTTGIVAAIALLVAPFTIWSPGPEQIAGVIALELGLAAWVVGAFFAPRLFSSTRDRRIGATVLVCAVGLEAAVTTLQAAGVPILPTKASVIADIGDGGRFTGTFGHPGPLGKAVVCIMILLLMLLSDEDQKTRRRAWLGIFLSFVALGFSEGRANIVAAVVMILFWAAISPSSRIAMRQRVAVPIVLAIIAVPFVGPVVERFQNDPQGGFRPQLTKVGYQQIASSPWVGIGPNRYMSVVSRHNSLADKGYPVHNVFLLSAAELGIPLAALFWTPLLVLVARCVRLRKAHGLQGAVATAFLASVPGFYLMTTTGWGFLSERSFSLWFLVLGAVWGLTQRVPAARPAVARMPSDTHVQPSRASLAGAGRI